MHSAGRAKYYYFQLFPLVSFFYDRSSAGWIHRSPLHEGSLILYGTINISDHGDHFDIDNGKDAGCDHEAT